MSQIKTKFITDLAVTNAKVATGIDAVKLADGSVTNSELQFINSLTSNAQTQLGGKASTLLDNLGVTAINDHLLPATAALYSLGSSTKNWDQLFVQVLVDVSLVTAFDIEARALSDLSGTAAIDFAARFLYDGGGDVAMDWEPATEVRIKPATGAIARKLSFYNGAGTFSAAIKAPALAASYTLTLPVDDGNSGEVLRTDGSGVLSWVAAATAENRAKQTFTLSAGDITAQKVTLTNAPLANSVHFIVKGGAPTLEGAAHDYSVTGSDVNFLNDLATGGAAALIAGDIVQVVYEY